MKHSFLNTVKYISCVNIFSSSLTQSVSANIFVQSKQDRLIQMHIHTLAFGVKKRHYWNIHLHNPAAKHSQTLNNTISKRQPHSHHHWLYRSFIHTIYPLCHHIGRTTSCFICIDIWTQSIPRFNSVHKSNMFFFWPHHIRQWDITAKG